MALFKKNPSVEGFVQQAREEFLRRQSELEIKYQLGDSGPANRWAVDMAAGTISFTSPEGEFVGPVQVIGSYSFNSNTFRWAWASDHVPSAVTQASTLARNWGLKNKQPNYYEGTIACTEDEAWEFTAVALKLSGLYGAYRGPTNEGVTLVFMVFGPLIEQQKG